MEMSVTVRLAIERRIVRHLIRTARKAGYLPVRVDDGDELIPTPTETAMLDAVFAVDDSRVIFKHPDEPRGHCAVIILGNGPDCVSDASMGGRWDAVMDAVADYCKQFN